MNVLVPLGNRSVTMDVDTAQLSEHRDLIDLQRTHFQVTDETGVPLESDRHDPPEEIDFDYVGCPYKDSPTRYPDGKPHELPMSNLEKQRLRHAYPQIQRQLLAVRAGYLQLQGFGETHELTAQDGFNILGALQFLPVYLVERATDPISPNDVLPQSVVVGANAASGATGALGAFAYGRNNMPMSTGQAILDAAESEPEGGLVGDKTVCAASPRVIVRYLNMLREGSTSIQTGSIEDETFGLLTEDELAAAIVFGGSLEATHYPHGIMTRADHVASQALAKYNPRKKHNPRRVRAPIDSFHQAVREFVASHKGLSASANSALGRKAYDKGEFTTERVYGKNEYFFHTVRIAREKGVELPEL